MLGIRAELLLGTYVATDPFASSDVAEWPPHPYRVHAALVGAACERGGSVAPADTVEALRWLESQGPPEIHCDRTPPTRSTATVYVPRNITSGAEWARVVKKGSETVPRVPRRFPAAVPRDPVVTYCWPAAEAPPRALASLIESVGWLGSSKSPVACGLVREAPWSEPLVAGPQGTLQLRVATTGTTDSLLSERFTHPSGVVPVAAGYAPKEAEPVPAPDAPVFSELVVRRVVGAVQDCADTPTITEALRSAVLGRAGDDAPGCLHGHTDRPHAAYLALGDVGHPGATGTIRGIALALPADVSPDERTRCLDAFAAVGPLRLPDGRWSLVIDDELDGLFTLAPERWTRPFRRWTTVTPIVLDRFPRRGRTVEDELRWSLVNAGLPEPVELEALAGPAVTGAPPAGSLRGPVRPGLRTHARLAFANAIRGPVLVGRSRFRGVGLLVPTP